MKLINLEATRAAYAPFETIEQLNANTKAIREQHNEMLIPSEVAVLEVLHRYASKHFGVCYLAKSTISEMVGLSRRQVIRICQRFEAMGIIVQYETNRKRCGGRTANTIVFLTQIAAREAFISSENNESNDNNDGRGSSESTGDVTGKGTNLDALKDAHKELKDLKITRDTENAVSSENEAVKQIQKPLLKDGLVAKLPSVLRNTLAPFFDADELYEMAGVVFKAKASVDKRIELESYETEYREAILSVANAYKRGQVRSFSGVLYRAIERVTSAIKHKQRVPQMMDIFGV